MKKVLFLIVITSFLCSNCKKKQPDEPCATNQTATIDISNESTNCTIDVIAQISGGQEKLGTIPALSKKTFTLGKTYTAATGTTQIITKPTCGKGLLTVSEIQFSPCTTETITAKDLAPDFSTASLKTCMNQEAAMTSDKIPFQKLRVGSIIYYKTALGSYGIIEILQVAYNLRFRIKRGSLAWTESSHTDRGTWLFDLDSAQETTISAQSTGDFWWEIVRVNFDFTVLQEANFTPSNGAKFYLAN